MPEIFIDETDEHWESRPGQYVTDTVIGLGHIGYTAERLAEEILRHPVLGAYFSYDELDGLIDVLTPVVIDYHTYQQVGEGIEDAFFEPLVSTVGTIAGWRRA